MLPRIETVLRRDRHVVLAGLITLTLLAWAYLIWQTRTMPGMGMAAHIALPQMQTWGAVELVMLWLMWAVMMVAMMVPSAAPLVLMFARADRDTSAGEAGSAAVLLSGYLLVWIGFSSLAAFAQWQLQRAALVSEEMVITNRMLAGVLLIGAGAFQFTRLKRVCLVHCRSPMSFLMREWRRGHWGTLRLGLKHGVYCVGCCWLLMTLLLVAGVMNLLWVAAIAAFVLVERVWAEGELLARLAGVVLVIAGIATIIAGIVV